MCIDYIQILYHFIRKVCVCWEGGPRALPAGTKGPYIDIKEAAVTNGISCKEVNLNYCLIPYIKTISKQVL